MRSVEVRSRLDSSGVNGMDREQLDEWITRQIEK